MTVPILTPRQWLLRFLVGVLALTAAMAACLLMGSQKASIGAALQAWQDGKTDSTDYQILFQIRLPRIVLAAIIGAALASSGCVFQALLRNPLADPYLLGVSSGAGLGMMLAVLCGWTWSGAMLAAMMPASFLGACSASALVWLLGRAAGQLNLMRLLLAGVVVNAFFSSTMLFLTSIAQASQIHAIQFWMMGNLLPASSVGTIVAVGMMIAVCVTFLTYLGQPLNILSFGLQDAAALGLSAQRIAFMVFTTASVMTAAAVSLSGLVGFVGLVVPHAVRLLIGADHRQLVPLSALGGAAFVVIADTVARTIVAPATLPVGVVCAMLGAPVFLVLLARQVKPLGGMR